MWLWFLFCFSGKLVSPKWKNFKGLKLQWRDKIRLNNAIWRAWYMQCKYQTGLCHLLQNIFRETHVRSKRELKLPSNKKFRNLLQAWIFAGLSWQCVWTSALLETSMQRLYWAVEHNQKFPHFMLVFWRECWQFLFFHILPLRWQGTPAEPTSVERSGFPFSFRPGEAQESCVPFRDSTGWLCWGRWTSSARGMWSLRKRLTSSRDYSAFPNPLDKKAA